EARVRSFPLQIGPAPGVQETERRQGTRTLSWSSARHPSPLLLRPDGTIRLLTTPPERLPVDRLCDELLGRWLPGRSDDVALLVLRCHPQSATPPDQGPCAHGTRRPPRAARRGHRCHRTYRLDTATAPGGAAGATITSWVMPTLSRRSSANRPV